MKECRGSRKGSPKTDDCKPYDYDGEGWPLGRECNGKLCGAWLCANPKHFMSIKVGKVNKYYCRVCVQTNNIPEREREKLGLK